MYITENQTIGESVLFLLSARRSLSEIVSASGSENAETLADFLINEASDYEVMSLLVDGKLPDEKYNSGHEFYLFSTLKESVLSEAGNISEAMGNGAFADFMTKVDSVFPAISTQAPVLEFFAMQNKEVAIATLLEAGETATLGQAAAKAHETIAQKAQLAPGRGWEAIQAWAKGASQGAQDLAAKVGPKISAFAKTPEGLAVGGAALAALLIYASAKTYKRFLSQAAKACSGQSGAAKSQCMREYRGKAKAAQAADLAKAAGACAKTKNPAACKAALQRKAASLKG